MHRPGRLTQTNTGSSAVYPLDRYVAGYALMLTELSGTATATVELIASDFQRGESEIASDHSVLAAVSASTNSQISFIPRGLKLTVSGTGVWQLDILPNSSVA